MPQISADAGFRCPRPLKKVPIVNLVNWFVWQCLIAVVSAVIGGVATWYLVINRVINRVRAKLAESQVADEVAQVLDVLAAGGLVITAANTVAKATVAAVSMGLVQNRSLVHKELIELVDRARVSDLPEDISLELSAGLAGESLFIDARAGAIGGGNVLLLVEDRTEAQRLGEARRDFVANISHELKTPVGAIILLTEAIAGAGGDPQTVAKFAKSLNRESHRLSSLVQDVIQLSKLQGGVALPNPLKLDLNQVVEEAIERNSILAENRGVAIRFEPGADVWVIGDAEMLASAVKNLVENAILYSPAGSWVGVGLREIDGVAEVSVIDHGVGIAPADQDRVFERFYRVDASRSRETGGTGIGLAIVKHVAANHRGEVKLFSQVGLGSTFTLRIPVADEALEAPDISQVFDEIIERGGK